MILMHDFLHVFFSFSNFDQLGLGQIFQKGNGSWIDDSDAAAADLLAPAAPAVLFLSSHVDHKAAHLLRATGA